MLISRRHLDGIVAGQVTLAFRRWERARVKPGTRLRTGVGVIVVDDVSVVDRVEPAELVQAGIASADDIPGVGLLFRIALHYQGADPRIALREGEPSESDIARVDAMGSWALDYLRLIADQPGVRAADLAAQIGRETLPFKRDVRKLKELGLTESLEVGYRLSPRGWAVLRR
ncbi:MAG: hypothetical protein ABWZ26_08565 [Candidatus Nanopelagicales bacterium]